MHSALRASPHSALRASPHSALRALPHSARYAHRFASVAHSALSVLCALCSALCTLRFALCALCSVLCALCALCLCFTLRASRCARRTPRFSLYAPAGERAGSCEHQRGGGCECKPVPLPWLRAAVPAAVHAAPSRRHAAAGGRDHQSVDSHQRQGGRAVLSHAATPEQVQQGAAAVAGR